MQQRWIHYRTACAPCPVCGKPAHVGLSLRGGGFWWLHDSASDWLDCRLEGDSDALAIPLNEAKLLIDGHHPSGSSNSKRVRCVETGEEFSSIKRAADSAGVKGPTVSQALKLGCAAGGYHWEYAD